MDTFGYIEGFQNRPQFTIAFQNYNQIPLDNGFIQIDFPASLEFDESSFLVINLDGSDVKNVAETPVYDSVANSVQIKFIHTTLSDNLDGVIFRDKKFNFSIQGMVYEQTTET